MANFLKFNYPDVLVGDAGRGCGVDPRLGSSDPALMIPEPLLLPLTFQKIESFRRTEAARSSPDVHLGQVFGIEIFAFRVADATKTCCIELD